MRANDILETVKAAIEAAFAGEKVYTDYLPKDFERPASAIELREETVADANIGLVRRTVVLGITVFTAVNEYYDSDRLELNRRQRVILDLLGPGCVAVGGRSIGLRAQRGATTPDYAEILLTFEWVDARPGYVDPEDPAQTADIPTMQNFEIRKD